MKKIVFKLGIPLSRAEAGKILGGTGGQMCASNADCPMDSSCINGMCDGGEGEGYDTSKPSTAKNCWATNSEEACEKVGLSNACCWAA